MKFDEIRVGVVIITKDRYQNLTSTLSQNLAHLSDVPIVVVDASQNIQKLLFAHDCLHQIVPEKAGQYNQKAIGTKYLMNHYELTHVVFLDDDIYLNEPLHDLIEKNYSQVNAPLNTVVISFFIKEFSGRSKFLDFLKTHSFKKGFLAKNTFGSNTCIGQIQEIDWALGGACCWPVKFCPKVDDDYPVKKGKAYLEDAYLSSIHRHSIKIFSSETSKIEHRDFYIKSDSLSSCYQSGRAEFAARWLICKKVNYFNAYYMNFSIFLFGLLVIIFSIFNLRFKKVAYAIGLFSGILSISSQVEE